MNNKKLCILAGAMILVGALGAAVIVSKMGKMKDASSSAINKVEDVKSNVSNDSDINAQEQSITQEEMDTSKVECEDGKCTIQTGTDTSKAECEDGKCTIQTAAPTSKVGSQTAQSSSGASQITNKTSQTASQVSQSTNKTSQTTNQVNNKVTIVNGTKENFQSEVLNSNKKVLVDFYATWCGPCQQLSPIIDAIAKEHPEIKVVKVNYDEQKELISKYEISCIPTVIVFQGGTAVKRAVAPGTKQEVEDLIK